MRWAWKLSCLVLACGLGVGASTPSAAPVAADDSHPDTLTVVDVDGKERQVTGIKFTVGVRRLAWLADPNGGTEDARKGPLALEFRDAQSTTFVKGVVTLVPLASVESASYDYKDQAIRLQVKGLKEPLTGSLKYKGFNALSFSGVSDGKAGTFHAGGAAKSTVKSVAFSAAVPLPSPKPTGTTWAVQIVQLKEKDPALSVRNLKLLYQYPGGVEKLEDSVPVRKGAMLSLSGGFKRLEVLAMDTNTNIAAAEVEPADGPERLIAIPLTQQMDKKTGTLVGFVGEVEAGWKLFPFHSVKQMTLTDVKKKVE